MRRAWAAALACLGGCVVDGEVCATRHGVPVPPVIGGDRVELDFDVAVPPEELGPLAGAVRFDRVTFHAASGITDLAWVQSAQISLDDGAVVGCDAGCGDGPDVTVPIDQVAREQVSGRATIVGAMPSVTWTLDIEVCARPGASGAGSRW